MPGPGLVPLDILSSNLVGVEFSVGGEKHGKEWPLPAEARPAGPGGCAGWENAGFGATQTWFHHF